jgi:hypothetical protein
MRAIPVFLSAAYSPRSYYSQASVLRRAEDEDLESYQQADFDEVQCTAAER